MRVGYLTVQDPTDPWCWSGTGHHMYKSLMDNGLEVVHIGRTLLPLHARLPHPFARAAQLLGCRWHGEPAPAEQARRWAAGLSRELDRIRCDILFAPVASMELKYLETDLPIAYTTDTTFQLLRNYYSSLTNLSPDLTNFREEAEAHAIARANLLLYPSYWAAESATGDYGADPAKVRVIPYGANLPAIPSLETVLARRRFDVCRLLFVGKDWERKGGDIAVECLKALLAEGIEAILTVCGGAPPAHARHPNVVYAGMLNKRKPRDLARYYRLLEHSHFMFVPSRAEAYGIVFCEASAFGVPSLATQTGGIPTIVQQGENGYLLPVSASGHEFANIVAKQFTNEKDYLALARSSRDRFDETLNWRAWGERTAEELQLLRTRHQERTH